MRTACSRRPDSRQTPSVLVRVDVTRSDFSHAHPAPLCDTMADFASVMQKVEGTDQKQQQVPPVFDGKDGPRVLSAAVTAAAATDGADRRRSLKLYKARWMMLVVYMLYSMANAVHWIQYSIISNITAKFYDVSSFAIDTTSTIYMIVYVPLVIPASWVLDRLVSGDPS